MNMNNVHERTCNVYEFQQHFELCPLSGIISAKMGDTTIQKETERKLS